METIVMINETTYIYFSMIKLVNSKYNNMILCSYCMKQTMEIADGIARYISLIIIARL